MINRKYILLLSALVLLPSCDMGSSSYTLYKLSPSSQTERIIVQVFKDAKTEEENLNACHKFRVDLLSKEETEEKYWCEKGGA